MPIRARRPTSKPRSACSAPASSRRPRPPSPNSSKRYPQSGYNASALFWLGNAQYATRNYNEAIANFRSMLSLAPDHAKAPEAVLSIANCQIELKDTRAARRTLEEPDQGLSAVGSRAGRPRASLATALVPAEPSA